MIEEFLRHLQDIVNMIFMKKQTFYVAPEVEIFELMTEGILCSSTGNEGIGETPGVGEWS